MSQTSYSIEQPITRAGLIANATTPNNIRSYSAEGANGIPFGLGVVHGTDPERQVAVPSAAGNVFAGFLVHDHARETLRDSNEPSIMEMDTASVMSFGDIWAIAGEAVSAGAQLGIQADGASAGQLFAAPATPLSNPPSIKALGDSITLANGQQVVAIAIQELS